MSFIAELLLFVASLPALVASGYLFLLALLSRRAQESMDPSQSALRFDIVVPAHDEAAGIEKTVRSLRGLDYPAGSFRILVVADNCSDETAILARAAGAEVLERKDPERRGKGYALAFAFAESEREAWADALVVIDADTEVTPNLLKAFARRLDAGEKAVQASYGVRNALASWRTRLLVIALALFHDLRSLARERLGLSVGLRGNGMGFSAELLREVPYDSFSLVEDLEFGVKLAQAGYRVGYVHEAMVRGDMAAHAGADTQRRRWEEGRRKIARTLGPKLLSRGLAERNKVLFDLAMDVLVPPLAQLVLVIAVGVLASLISWLSLGGSPLPAIPWLLCSSMLVSYVLRGLWLSGTGIRGALDLMWTPIYILWKISLWLRRRRHAEGEWVRTERGGSTQ